jgi:hypothetical protein
MKKSKMSLRPCLCQGQKNIVKDRVYRNLFFSENDGMCLKQRYLEPNLSGERGGHPLKIEICFPSIVVRVL